MRPLPCMLYIYSWMGHIKHKEKCMPTFESSGPQYDSCNHSKVDYTLYLKFEASITLSNKILFCITSLPCILYIHSTMEHMKYKEKYMPTFEPSGPQYGSCNHSEVDYTLYLKFEA